MMTGKERMLAAMAGRELDRFPVVVPYLGILQCDHWTELTGLPPSEFHAWTIQDPAEHAKRYGEFDRQLPFDIMDPRLAPSREDRENLKVVARDGRHYFLDRRTGDLSPLTEDLPHMHPAANQEQRVFDREDVRRLVDVQPAASILEGGRLDFVREAARLYPHKLMLTGVAGTFYECSFFVGQENLLAMLHEAPGLIEYLQDRLLERIVEEIRAHAAAGYDALWIDDAMSTSDVISVRHYERFSLPRVRALVQEIHRQGMKAILTYFGGVADRIPQLLSLGADALNMEASMKGYVNDLDLVQQQVGDRICLWGNLDPFEHVQLLDDASLRQELSRQMAVGRRTGKFVVSTGSPITPLTPLGRIKQFIDLAWELGSAPRGSA